MEFCCQGYSDNVDFYVCMLFFRWIPPSLPTAKSPDLEKESGATYAAGRSRVFIALLVAGWFSFPFFSWLTLLFSLNFSV